MVETLVDSMLANNVPPLPRSTAMGMGSREEVRCYIIAGVCPTILEGWARGKPVVSGH